MTTSTIGFGGGCHWCTEGVFNALRGVSLVSQGFIQSTAPNDSFSEAVVVEYEADEIPLEALIEVHLRTHASTSNHTMRGKYRSAIYVYSDTQAQLTAKALGQLQSDFDKLLVTQVLPYGAYKASDKRFVDYAEKNAGGPFCKAYIDPKLQLLRQEYAQWLKPA